MQAKGYKGIGMEGPIAFRFMLLKRAYTKAQFESFISESRFQKAEIEETPDGFEISLAT